MSAGHRRTTVEQFTRQAAGFAAAHAHVHADGTRQLLRVARVTSADRALDVACGPGIVAAALADQAAHVTGIDLTPEMVGMARERCAEAGLANVSFDLGDVESLPYHDAAFSLVTCRYALHHLLAPERAVAEMARVCAPGGRVVVADVAADPEPRIAERFNAAERARDPSHVAALTVEQILGLLGSAGLEARVAGTYELEAELDSLLARSASPDPDAVRARFEHAIDSGETLGVRERREGGGIRFEFPVAIVVGERPQ